MPFGSQRNSSDTASLSIPLKIPHRMHLIGEPGELSLSGGAEDALEVCGHKRRDEAGGKRLPRRRHQSPP